MTGLKSSAAPCPGHSSSSLPSLGCEAEPQEKPLPTSHTVSAPCHGTLPSCQTLGWCARECTPPPCSSAEYGQDGNKIKRKRDFFFPSCILATAPTQRSKYKIFYPPPFQAISMLKCRKKQDGNVKTDT